MEFGNVTTLIAWTDSMVNRPFRGVIFGFFNRQQECAGRSVSNMLVRDGLFKKGKTERVGKIVRNKFK